MSENLTAVLAGCGSIAESWLKACAIYKDLEIAGLVDLDEQKARQRAKEYGFSDAVTGSDLSKVLQQTTPDMVFDCTVPVAHVDVVTTALEHGCHVLGEKPMADSMANAKTMVAAAKKADRIYAVTQTFRYYESLKRLKEVLASGVIGKITTVNSDFYIGAHFDGFRQKMDHVLLLDMSIHSFDMARMISGADPVSVYCKEWNPSGSWYKHGASATAIFDMTDGIVYSYRGSWCSEGMTTSWHSNWRIIGENGTILWDGLNDLKVQVIAEKEDFIYTYEDVEVKEIEEKGMTPHAGVIGEFLDCLKTGKSPQTICTDNIKSLAMVFAAIESAANNKQIKIQL